MSPLAYPWTASSSLSADAVSRPCPACHAQARCLCVSEDGAPMPHAIHAGRVALAGTLEPTGIPGFFTIVDRSEVQ